MADLQTEIFTKVLPKMQQLNNLKFDDDVGTTPEIVEVEGPPATKLETVWQFVRDNPRCKVSDVIAGCPNLAVGTPSSLLNQLHTRGYLSKEGRYPALYTITDLPYKSMTKEERVSALLSVRNLRKSLGRPTDKERAAKAAKAAKAVKTKKPAPEPVAPTVQVTPVDLNTLSIVQARKLYDELKQIFGA
jgi:hypothetical protein